MNNLSFKEATDRFIPNFRRFQDKLGNENEVVMNLEQMFRKVFDLGLMESIGKHINLELGLCILKDQEIDQKKLKEIMDTFKNS
ncbi:MAG: hypothetical protein PHS92_02900 [Candidatus Gracilibacteria bacterium]|nr:hypothetical protein [Candidatus Gracilibacteria bacterium]